MKKPYAYNYIKRSEVNTEDVMHYDFSSQVNRIDDKSLLHFFKGKKTTKTYSLEDSDPDEFSLIESMVNNSD